MTLWVTASVATLGFLVALEVAARHYGVPGPITNQAREVIFAPESGPLLYAGLALMMVVLTWRQRFFAMGAAIGIDVAFFLVRWAVDAEMNFGNGALLVILGYAIIALIRRTGRERVLLLKGVGLGLLLMAGHKTGDTWLHITAVTHPTVLDPYVATADHALGNPSWLAGQIVAATDPVGPHVLYWVYGQLPLAAAVFALYQLRHVAELNTAFIGGTAGGLLSSCLSNGIACKALLIAATSGIPDPEGAAILIESVAKVADKESLKIDTRELREQGADLKRRMEQIMRSVQDQQHQQGQAQQQGQNTVGEGVIMYG